MQINSAQQRGLNLIAKTCHHAKDEELHHKIKAGFDNGKDHNEIWKSLIPTEQAAVEEFMVWWRSLFGGLPIEF